jgi:TatD DNase family protein
MKKDFYIVVPFDNIAWDSVKDTSFFASFKNFWASINSSDDLIKKEIDFITKNKNKIVAIGEIGLDYYWVKNEHLLDRQRELFKQMIRLANSLNKPVIVHTRKAEEDSIKILEDEKANAVILHSFGGKLKLLPRILSNGWFLSVPPSIVRSSHFQELVKRTPITNLLTETDAPFLSPFKDRKNEPSFVKLTIDKIAELKNLTVEEVENNIFMNYQKIFSQ